MDIKYSKATQQYNFKLVVGLNSESEIGMAEINIWYCISRIRGSGGCIHFLVQKYYIGENSAELLQINKTRQYPAQEPPSTFPC